MKFRKVKIELAKTQNFSDVLEERYWRFHYKEMAVKPNRKQMKEKKRKKMNEKDMGKKWEVVDRESGQRMKSFDDINQAKKWCIENDFDFGLY